MSLSGEFLPSQVKCVINLSFSSRNCRYSNHRLFVGSFQKLGQCFQSKCFSTGCGSFDFPFVGNSQENSLNLRGEFSPPM